MKCPFCGEEMILGHIQPTGFVSVFWLPMNVDYKDLCKRSLTVQKIEEAGGRILGTATNHLLLSATLCDTFLCKTCNYLISQL